MGRSSQIRSLGLGLGVLVSFCIPATFVVAGENTPAPVNRQLFGSLSTNHNMAVAGMLDWQNAAPVPAPRGLHGSATVGDKVYVVGGYGSVESAGEGCEPFSEGSYTCTVFQYNPEEDSWSGLSQLPYSVRGPLVIGLDDRLFVFGNDSVPGPSARTLLEYDPGSGSWIANENLFPGFAARTNAVAEGIDGYIYVYSFGFGLYRIDPDHGDWELLDPQGSDLFYMMSAVVQDRLIVAGGFDSDINGDVYSSAVRAFDPSTMAWATLPNMPRARSAGAATGIGRFFIASGGGTDLVEQDQYAMVDVLDTATGTWSSAPSLSTARLFHGLDHAAGRLVATGGWPVPFTGIDGHTDSVEVLSVDFLSIDVNFDIRPNHVNPHAGGVIPAVIFGSDSFDAADIDVTSLSFGPDGARPAHNLTDSFTYNHHLQDTNLDGYMDLVVHFRASRTGIACGHATASLSGETISGQLFKGTDSFRTVGCRPGAGRG